MLDGPLVEDSEAGRAGRGQPCSSGPAAGRKHVIISRCFALVQSKKGAKANDGSDSREVQGTSRRALVLDRTGFSFSSSALFRNDWHSTAEENVLLNTWICMTQEMLYCKGQWNQ